MKILVYILGKATEATLTVLVKQLLLCYRFSSKVSARLSCEGVGITFHSARAVAPAIPVERDQIVDRDSYNPSSSRIFGVYFFSPNTASVPETDQIYPSAILRCIITALLKRGDIHVDRS